MVDGGLDRGIVGAGANPDIETAAIVTGIAAAVTVAVADHRAGTVAVSGTPVVRPSGQKQGGTFGASTRGFRVSSASVDAVSNP